MRFKRGLLVSSSLLGMLLGSQAYAQSTNTIEELVVTAEKREQSLQDIPVAISAFTSEQRDVIGIQSIQDMTNFTPGLQYSTSTDRVSLRGLGRLTNVLSADASVANYADGVYETFAVRAGSSTLFLDRVEILRGPQGTLYGRNSIAGAINILSRRPTDSPYAEARVTYGNYNRSIVEGAISGPLSDNVKARLAVNWESQTKGYIDNTVPGLPDEGNVLNTFYAEAQIDVKFSEKLEGWAKFGYTNWRNGAGGPGSGSGGWTPRIYNFDGSVKPDISPTNPNGGNGFNIIEFPTASTHFNPGFGCSGLATAVTIAGGSCVNASNDSPWKINRPNAYSVRVPNAYTVAIHLTYHAPGVDVKYIGGGVRYWYHLKGTTPGGSFDPPVTQFNAGPLTVYPQERFDYQERNGFISHELNLVSTTEGPLSWITGAYYYHQSYKQPVHTIEDPRQTQWNIVPPFGVCLLGGQTGPATAAACPAGTGRRFDNRPSVENTSYAFYGQASYEVSETLTLTGGLRYSHDKKYGTERVRLLCFGLPACIGLPPEIFVAPLDLTGVQTVVAGGSGVGVDQIPTGVQGRTTYDAQGFSNRRYLANWSAVTGTAKAEWQPDEDTLVYTSYSRGYRSGGFNIGIFTVQSYLPYSDKETVDALELGLKKNWSGSLQTNVALYHYAYKNLQIPISQLQNGTGPTGLAVTQQVTSFYNTPKSRSQGVEVEVLWQPIDNLQIIGTYSYIDAQIRNGSAVDTTDPTAVAPGARPLHTVAQCMAGGAAVAGDCFADPFTVGQTNGGFTRLQSLKGNDLPNAPRNKVAVAANYTWIFDPGSLTGTVSYAWRDNAYGSLFKRWYSKAPTWDQVDTRVLFKDAKGKYEFIAYVKNVFDTIGYDQGATSSRLEGVVSSVYPTVPGLTCQPVAGPTRACLQGITKTFYATPPRTYGIELRYKFF